MKCYKPDHGIAIGDPVIKRWGGIPLPGLTPPYFCACPKPGPRFPTSYKGNNKITELRTILQRESQNS